MWLAFSHKTTAFYFSPSRAWELLLGAIVALRPRTPRLPKLAFDALSALGLALVIAPVALVDGATPWPAPYALLPCGGAALFIWVNASHDTLARRLLSLKPVAGLGLISYSLYLWHWPLFYFYSRAILRVPTPIEYAFLIAAAIALAWISWRFIEQPFRNRQGRWTRPAIFKAAAAAGVLLVATGAVDTAADGLPARFPADAARASAHLGDPSNPGYRRTILAGICFVSRRDHHYDLKRCLAPTPHQADILLWGDSQAMHFMAGFRREAQAAGEHVALAAFSGCRPIVTQAVSRAACRLFNQRVFASIDGRFAAVILSGRVVGRDKLIPLMRDTARQIARKGIPVVILGPSPEYELPGPLYVARYLTTRDAALVDSHARLEPEIWHADEKLRRLTANEPGIAYISVLETVCPERRCPMIDGDTPVNMDRMHFTLQGSQLVAKRLWPRVEAAVAAARRSLEMGAQIAARRLPPTKTP